MLLIKSLLTAGIYFNFILFYVLYCLISCGSTIVDTMSLSRFTHSTFEEKEEILKRLYELKKEDLMSIGIDITLDELMSYYN